MAQANIKRKRRPSILIVDDETGICETLADIFEAQGYLVDKAYSGEEAIEKARRKFYNVLFVDMKMPSLNGCETYVKIKRLCPKTAAIVMTAYRKEVGQLVIKSVKKGAHACLYKPFDPQKALDLVKKLLKKNKGR